CRYLPDFKVQDPEVSQRVSILHLLNHTTGWEELPPPPGEGDDALARYVAAMVDLPQSSPLGGRAMYNSAAYGVAGRVIEAVTKQTYEDAVRSLLLDPL